MTNIHPVFDRLIQREDRQERLNQFSKVIWLTGLSGSGKTTIAQALERKLYNEGFFAQVLDGDNLRSGLNKNLGFSIEDRQENIRRIAELTKLYLHSGIITINSFISPTEAIRSFAKNIIGEEDFIEIYIKASLELCESRDTKGLYAKARKGEIKNFTGISSPYEAPKNPAITIDTGKRDLSTSVDEIYKLIIPLIRYS